MDAAMLERNVAERSSGFFAEIVSNMPASYFGIVLGLASLASAWCGDTLLCQPPDFIGDWFYLVASIVWAAFVVLYILKALLEPDKFAVDAAHPVRCFTGLTGVATMLMAGGLVPHSHASASVLFAVGFAYTLFFAASRTGGLRHGEGHPGNTTAVLYLPTVAGSFISATIVSALGHPDGARLAFGAGLFSWLAMESMLLHRLLTGPHKAVELRPALGIQLAPAPVGAVAYLVVSGGTPGIFVHAVVGYGVVQLLVLAASALDRAIGRHPRASRPRPEQRTSDSPQPAELRPKQRAVASKIN